MNIKIKIILFLILLPNILVWAITREDILSNAQTYSNLNWTVNTVNTRYSIFSVKGRNITGEAYSFGNKQNVFYFQSAMKRGKSQEIGRRIIPGRIISIMQELIVRD